MGLSLTQATGILYSSPMLDCLLSVSHIHVHVLHTGQVQWDLSNTDTLDQAESVLINEVS